MFTTGTTQNAHWEDMYFYEASLVCDLKAWIYAFSVSFHTHECLINVISRIDYILYQTDFIRTQKHSKDLWILQLHAFSESRGGPRSQMSLTYNLQYLFLGLHDTDILWVEKHSAWNSHLQSCHTLSLNICDVTKNLNGKPVITNVECFLRNFDLMSAYHFRVDSNRVVSRHVHWLDTLES